MPKLRHTVNQFAGVCMVGFDLDAVITALIESEGRETGLAYNEYGVPMGVVEVNEELRDASTPGRSDE